MASTSQSQSLDATNVDKDAEYGVRMGYIFIIDTTPPMFTKDPKEDIPLFQLCFREYVQILRDKLVWSRQDWIGVILLGTEKWDTDPEIKNVLTLEKLNVVSVDSLKKAMDILKEKWEYYKDISSPTSYPLHDVLCHAAEAFLALKIVMPRRKVILLTCRNDPPLDDTEKHRIRKKVASYADLRIQLNVLRLGDNWKEDNFYKDLELLSANINEEDYKPISFENFIDQVKRPSRVMALLPLRFGEDVTLDVHVRSICSTSKYIKTVKLDKKTHVPLQTFTHYKPVDDNEDDADEDEDYIPPLILGSEIRMVQTFAGREIYFTPEEVRYLRNFGPPGIDVIATAPVEIDPMYFLEAPKFVTCGTSTRRDNKLLFAAILDKCDASNFMLVCCVTLRRNSQPLRYNMIPNAKNGGFYLYRIPYKEEVRNFSEQSLKYVYDDNNRPPVDDSLVEGFTKIIKAMQMKYNPALFTNPKLKVQIYNLETLALDLEEREPPIDPTVPISEVVETRIGETVEELKEILKIKAELSDDPPVKKRKQAETVPISDDAMSNLAKNKNVGTCTAAQLKEFLKRKELKCSGTKADLANRIYTYFA